MLLWVLPVLFFFDDKLKTFHFLRVKFQQQILSSDVICHRALSVIIYSINLMRPPEAANGGVL